MSCPRCLYWNQEVLACDFPGNVNCGDLQTTPTTYCGTTTTPATNPETTQETTQETLPASED